MKTTLKSSEEKTILEIAKEHFYGLETLETRNSDSLDFYDAAVWVIHDALQAAYQAGKNASQRGQKNQK